MKGSFSDTCDQSLKGRWARTIDDPPLRFVCNEVVYVEGNIGWQELTFTRTRCHGSLRSRSRYDWAEHLKLVYPDLPDGGSPHAVLALVHGSKCLSRL
jgi:hypothetical protein